MAIEFGTAGNGKDDIQSSTFLVNGLSLNEIYGQDFGARLTSIGSPKERRKASVKLVAFAPGKTATLLDGLELGTASFTETSPLSPVTQEVQEGSPSSVTYSISVSVPDLPATADIVFMEDLTGSFSDDLPTVSASFTSLYDALNDKGRDIDDGGASFVDKPFHPSETQTGAITLT